MYALILAGGSGTRLWPYSRKARPKQFLPINGPRTMLQETVDRILPIIAPEQVLVATGEAYAELVAEQLPDVPRANILAEPAGRGTAPCIGWAALHLLRRDPDAVMAVLSADHRIEREQRFCAKLQVAAKMARQGYLVTLGIQPTMPSTGYGYIKRRDLIYTEGEHQVFQVDAFVEKPDADRARAYVASGAYDWNAGMFIWRADHILDELAQHRPRLGSDLTAIGTAIGTADERATLERIWEGIENVAIDVAVMEQTARGAVIPADLGWSDVGDWQALAETLAPDAQGNVVVGPDGLHIGIETTNSLIYGDHRLVATIGVRDLVVIDTGDALLICHRDAVQRVKQVVERLRDGHTELL